MVILVARTFATHPASLYVRWLGAIVLVSLCRLGLNLAFARAQAPAERLAPWRLAFLTALLWRGSSGASRSGCISRTRRSSRDSG